MPEMTGSIEAFIGADISKYEAAMSKVANLTKTAFANAQKNAMTSSNKIVRTVANIMAKLSTTTKGVGTKMASGITTGLNTAVGQVQRIAAKIGEKIPEPIKRGVSKLNTVFSKIGNFAKQGANAVVKAFESITGQMLSAGIKAGNAFSNGLRNASKKAQEVAKDVNDSFTKSTAKIAKRASIAAAAAASAFGAFAIKSAADVEVIEAQYEQAFKGVEKDANDLVDSMGKEFNMIPNRIKPGMSAFQSYFRGTGMTAKEALGTTKTAMTIASDAAAYYDKSIEETSQSLKGFLMGNFENGDAIGINTNLTKIATEYNRKYGGSFEDLSESAKQDFLLEYINDIYKLNGVMGQAGREGKQFQNVLGNLKTGFRDFAAAIAKPVMGPLIEGMSKAGEYLSKLTEKLNDAKNIGDVFNVLAGEIKPLVPALKMVATWMTAAFVGVPLVTTAIGAFGGLTTAIGSMAGPLGTVMSIFTGMISTIPKVGGALSNTATLGISAMGYMASAITSIAGIALAAIGPAAILGLVVAGIGLIYQQFGTQIDQLLQLAIVKGPEVMMNFVNGITSQIPLLVASGTQLVSNFATTLAVLIPTVFQAGIQIIASLVGAIGSNIGSIISSAITVVTSFSTSLLSAIPKLIVIGMSFLLNLVQGVIANIPQIVASAQVILMGFVNSLVSNLPTIISIGIQIIQSFIKGIFQLMPQLFNVGADAIVSLVDGIAQNIPLILNGAVETIREFISGINQALPHVFNAAVKIITSVIKGIVQNLPNIIAAGIKIVISLITGLVKALPTLVKGGGQVALAVVNGIKDGIVNFGAGMWDGLKNGIANLFGEGEQISQQGGQQIANNVEQ
ncbi:MAG TPA: hypothetical protein K8V19_06460, partial [Globicatella sulfidifaciens]|nr:hypothetical protein [Globicatella sulfidifaciens]